MESAKNQVLLSKLSANLSRQIFNFFKLEDYIEMRKIKKNTRVAIDETSKFQGFLELLRNPLNNHSARTFFGEEMVAWNFVNKEIKTHLKDSEKEEIYLNAILYFHYKIDDLDIYFDIFEPGMKCLIQYMTNGCCKKKILGIFQEADENTLNLLFDNINRFKSILTFVYMTKVIIPESFINLGKNEYIKTLVINYGNFNFESCKNLAQVIFANKTLTSLKLAENIFDHHGMLSICRSLKQNKTVEEIDLTRSKINDDEGVELFESLSEHPSIKSIDISFNDLGEKSGVSLSKLLQNTRSLEKLIIVSNEKIGNAGSSAIFEGFGKNSTIKDFKFSEIGYDEKVFPTLLKVLSENTSLTEYENIANNITEEQEMELERVLKKKGVKIHAGILFSEDEEEWMNLDDDI
jgi:hypothetical protein